MPIIIVDTVFSFLVNKLVDDHFSEYFHAYNVFESNEKEVIKAYSLVIYKIFDLQSAYGGNESQYIVPLLGNALRTQMDITTGSQKVGFNSTMDYYSLLFKWTHNILVNKNKQKILKLFLFY